MILKIFEDKHGLSRSAADHAANVLRTVIKNHGNARMIAATGVSQLEFLAALTKAEGIDWTQVEMFHLDEYIGLPISHPASFRKYLLENLIRKTGITNYHLLDGDRDPQEAIARVGAAIESAPIDLAFVGFGENGHLAFNDPPADFTTEKPYLIVNLDDVTRRQQVGEGWFADISEVPKQAISMSIWQIMKSKEILAIVPDARKAQAVKACLEGKVSPMAPASILRTHPAATIYLDKASASLLAPATVASATGRA